jgi:hypothetical protein
MSQKSTSADECVEIHRPENSDVFFFPHLSPTARLMLKVPEGSPVCLAHPPQQWKSDNTNSYVVYNVIMLLHLSWCSHWKIQKRACKISILPIYKTLDSITDKIKIAFQLKNGTDTLGSGSQWHTRRTAVESKSLWVLSHQFLGSCRQTIPLWTVFTTFKVPPYPASYVLDMKGSHYAHTFLIQCSSFYDRNLDTQKNTAY